MRYKIFLVLFTFTLLSSCDPLIDTGNPTQADGYVPVYSTDLASVKTIVAEAPRQIVKGGKIYTTGNLLFQVEQDSGIHIINYADPANPQKLGFIKSFLCKEVSVKNGFIYTNNLSDLVVIDISNPANIHEVSRTPGVFPDLSNQYPAKTNSLETVYFECPDSRKGVVVSWKRQSISNPKCWR